MNDIALNMDIDWLSLSFSGSERGDYIIQDSIDAHELMSSGLETLGFTQYVLKPAVPKKFYQYGFREELTGSFCYVARDFKKQGMLVMMSGSALKSPPGAQVVLDNALRALWKVTRIDVAFDVHNAKETVSEIYEKWMRDVRKLKKVHSFVRGAKGETLAIGSRSSERYMRVYDKGKEQGIETPWVRVEMEYKGRVALQVAEMVLGGAQAMAHDMTSYLGLPGSEVWSLLQSMTMTDNKPCVVRIRSESARERWFMTQVLPAFKNLAAEDKKAAQKVMWAFSTVIDFPMRWN